MNSNRAAIQTNANRAKPAALAIPGMDGNGSPIYSVIVKRTYDIGRDKSLTRSNVDAPIRLGDAFFDAGDGESSSVQFEAETAAWKPMTDIVVVGKAHAPSGVTTHVMDAGILIEGKGQKLIRVMGHRQCAFRPGLSPVFSEPAAFTEMELRYENAFGGVDSHILPGTPFHYPRNPLGKGFAIANTKAAIQGLALPNLEDPQDLLTPERLMTGEPEGWRTLPMPASLGWFPKTCYPRSFLSGILPPYLQAGSVTREEWLGAVPKNHVELYMRQRLPSFLPRFQNGASMGLSFPYLTGTESIRIKGLSSEGIVEFALPGEAPQIDLDIGLPHHPLNPFLATVLIRMEDMQVDLIWIGSRPFPGPDWLPEMKTLNVEIQ